MIDRPRKNRLHAFTIVELLVVIAVIGILAAITIVVYSGVQKTAIDKSVMADANAVEAEITRYSVKHNGSLGAGVQWYSKGAVNANIMFTPSSGNVIDVVASTTNYCIRVYNPRANNNTIQNAYLKGSDASSCSQLEASFASGGAFTPVALSGTAIALEAKSLDYSVGSSVGTWDDLSEGARHATSYSGAPTVGIEGGKKHVSFTTGQALWSNSLDITGAQPRTIIAKVRSSGPYGNIFGWGQEANGRIFDAWFYSADKIAWHGYGPTFDNIAVAPIMEPGFWYIVQIKYTGSAVVVQVNDQSAVSYNTVINTADSRFYIGAGGYSLANGWAGDMRALYVWNRILTPAETTSVKTYLDQL